MDEYPRRESCGVPSTLINVMRSVIFPMVAVSWFCLAAFPARAEDSNQLFLPQKEFLVGNTPWKHTSGTKYNILEVKEVSKEALQSEEFRPAALDPEAHWGPVIYGLQLSIRAETNVFVAGEPIPVSAIIRNTTTNDLRVLSVSRGQEVDFYIQPTSEQDSPPCFSGRPIFHSDQPIAPDSPRQMGISVYGFIPLKARHQIRYEFNLAFGVPKEPGVYELQGEQQIFEFLPNTERTAARTNLTSGVFTIKLNPQ